MKNKDEHIDPVLIVAKFLAHEATVEEIEWLEYWTNSKEENRKVFDQYKCAWDESEKVKHDKKINIEEEWQYLQSKIAAKKSKKLRLITPNNIILTISRIAAVFIIGIFIAYVVFFGIKKSNSEAIVAKTEIITNTLPDGSEVTLNNNSKIIYAKNFNKENERKITLKGEAYFDVKHDESKKFIIDAGEIIVEVLGTSFYVNATKKSETIEVVVSSGKVGVYKKNEPNKKTILVPGNKAVYNKKIKSITKNSNQDPNYLSWKTKKLKFRNKKLSYVVKYLNKVYNTNIIIESNKAANCRITTSFDNQSIDEILIVLQAILNIEISKKDNTIIILGEGC